jgi:hypothetical protein
MYTLLCLICAHAQDTSKAYDSAISALADGQETAIPRPHPKFTTSDMQRIANQGPLFRDVVLQHVERVDATHASGYNYIPSAVLGDWTYEVEPQWQQLPEVSNMQVSVAALQPGAEPC